MLISDWSSDVCSSDLVIPAFAVSVLGFSPTEAGELLLPSGACFLATLLFASYMMQARGLPPVATVPFGVLSIMVAMWMLSGSNGESGAAAMMPAILLRSEEHTSELQSLMRTSYAVFCLKKKTIKKNTA